MNSSDSELLRRFVDDGAEDAFTELVRRHLDLVFSAALRQVGPDTQAAEDVALKVFADLARKSSDLVAHPTLTGWLFGSTRLAAMEYRRFESRRIARETRAHAMSQLLSDATAAEPDWNRVRPVLDEAILELNDDDREAVLLRYFEKRPLAEIGSRLGLSENTARMRVDRALDKLHAALARRGITSATGALAAALGANAVSAAPAGMVERIGRKASGSRPAVGGRVLSGRGSGIPGGWMAVVTALFLAGIGVLMWSNRTPENAGSDSTTLAAIAAATNGGLEPPSSLGTGGHGVADKAAGAGNSRKKTPANLGEGLKLTVLASDSGQPVPGVLVSYFQFYNDEENMLQGERSTASGDGSGIVLIPFRPKLTRLTFETYVEGFASITETLIFGEYAPTATNQILRLDRAPMIGGTVVDPDGNPVANATISFMSNSDGDPSAVSKRPTIPSISPVTGPDGRWKMQAVAESSLPKLAMVADHEVFANSDPVNLASKPEVLASFLERTHVFHLKRAGTVRGVILDESGRPLDGVNVFVGVLDSSSRTKTANGGGFEIHGLNLRSDSLTAQAEGYATKTIAINVAPDMKPLRLVLDRGSSLRLRVMNRFGQGLSNAEVTLDVSAMSPSATVPTQGNFSGRTDAEGRLEWNQAPSGTNFFKIQAPEYLGEEQVEVASDGIEHVITLGRFYVHGSVTDAKTGKPVPKTKVTFGWPQIDPHHSRTNARFSINPRSGVSGSSRDDGNYGYLLREKLMRGSASPGCCECFIKIEAEGYQPFISRPVRYDEEDVTLDASLKKASEIEVTLLDPDGRPASGAETGIIEPNVGFNLRYGRLLARLPNMPVVIRRTDSEGKFGMTENPQATRLVAVHPAGFLAASLENIGSNPVFRLQRWSRIEGTLRGMAGSATGRVMTLAFQDFDDDALAIEDEASVDPEGRFEFPKAPPGGLRVRQMTVRRASVSTVFKTVGRSEDVLVAPGKTENVTLGGGYMLTGRLRLPAGISVPKGGYLDVLFTIPGPKPPAGIRNNMQAVRQWAMTPETQALSRRAVYLGAMVQDNASFLADTIESGRHEMIVMVMPPPSAQPWNPARPLATFTREVVIPEQPGEGRIDLGDIPFEAPDR